VGGHADRTAALGAAVSATFDLKVDGVR